MVIPVSPRKIAELQLVVSLRIRCAPFVAQAKIQGEFGSDLPVILHVKGGLDRFIRYRRNDVQLGILRRGITNQQGRKWIALIVVSQAAIGILGGHVPREVENSRGIVRLKEVVEELPLLAAECDRMRPFHPLQRRRVAVERVRKSGVHAALGKHGEERVSHVDGGDPVQSVLVQNGRQPHITQRRIVIAYTGRVYPIDAKAVRPECRWFDRPVIFKVAVLYSRR